MAVEQVLAEIAVDLVGRVDKLERTLREVEKDAGRKGDKAAKAFKSKFEGPLLRGFSRLKTAAVGLFAGFVTTKAVRGLAKLVGLSSDTEESLNKVREVFGPLAEDIESFAKRGARALGASRQETLAMTGEIGNLLVAMKATPQEAAKMSREIVQLAADLGSFNNVPTVEALNAIRASLVGETEPIRRFGSDVRVARLENIAMAKGVSKSALATNALTKAQITLGAIFEDTKKAQGDFARTSTGLANASKILQGQLKDLGAAIGTFLIPVASKVVGFFNKFIKSITTDRIDKFIERLKELGAPIETIERLELNRDIQKALASQLDTQRAIEASWLQIAEQARRYRSAAGDRGAFLSQLKGLVDIAKGTKDVTDLQNFLNQLTEKQAKLVAKAGEEENAGFKKSADALNFKAQQIREIAVQTGEFIALLAKQANIEKTITQFRKGRRGGDSATTTTTRERTEIEKVISRKPVSAAEAQNKLLEQAEAIHKQKLGKLDTDFDEERRQRIQDLTDAEMERFHNIEDITSAFFSGLLRLEIQTENRIIQGFSNMANAFISQVERMIAKWLAFQALRAIPGLGGIGSILGFGGGGSARTTTTGIVGAQSGANFQVPSGFPNDRFLLGLSSREHVRVTPASRVNSDAKILKRISSLIEAQTATMLSMDEGGVRVENTFDARGFTTTIEKEQQRRDRFG